MKNILFLLSFIFSYQVSAALDREIGFDIGQLKALGSTPATPAANKAKVYLKDGRLKLLTSDGIAENLGDNSGNLLKNYSFESGSTGWTATNGSCATSSGVTMDGTQNCLFTSSGTNWSNAQESTTNAARWAGQELTGSIWVGSVNSSDPIWLCPKVNGVSVTASVANGCTQYTAIGSPQKLTVQFIGGSTSNGIELKGSASGTVVGMDKAWVGERTNAVNGLLNTPIKTFTPVVSGLGSGSVASSGGTYHIIGEWAFINVWFVKDGTAGSGSASVEIAMPSGVAINMANVTVGSGGRATSYGGAYLTYNTGANVYAISVLPSSVSAIRFQSGTTSGAAELAGSSIGAGQIFSANIKVPISNSGGFNAFSTKCDDLRLCETVFSANVSSANAVSGQSTGTAYPWLASASWSSGTLTITPVAGMFGEAPNCWGISYVQGQRMAIASESANSISFTNRANDGTANANADVKVFCQKKGDDYARSKITQQIIQMRGVPTAPGATGGIDLISFKFGATISSACSATGACPYLVPLAGNTGGIVSFSRSTAGSYALVTEKTYKNFHCTGSTRGTANYTILWSTPSVNTNTFLIQTDTGAGSATDSWGTVNCFGSY
nr:hypothetical protein BHI3_07700 [Bacteriovorax sp. HI3]